jgi:polyisoprenoid-binding protein YceI
MKNTIYTIIIIILLAVAAFLIISPQKSEAPAVNGELSDETSMPADESVDNEDGYNFNDLAYTIDEARSEIAWEARKKFVGEHIDRGTISIAQGGISLPSGSSGFEGGIVINMNSIEVTQTGIGGGFGNLKRHLEGDDFFDVANNPEAMFMITGGDSDSIEGDLTIRGITAPAVVEVSEWNEEEMYVMGSMIANRTDFGIDFRKDGLAGVAKDQIIDENFTIDFKIYYLEN